MQGAALLFDQFPASRSEGEFVNQDQQPEETGDSLGVLLGTGDECERVGSSGRQHPG